MMATYTTRKIIQKEIDEIILSNKPFRNPYPIGSKKAKIFQEEATKHMLYPLKMAELRFFLKHKLINRNGYSYE